MKEKIYLRTSDLARATEISVQQVRNYEAGGFLPAVERSPSGYRRYTRRHLVALQATRQMIGGYGWQRTQEIMQAANQGRLAEALAAIDGQHAEIDRARQQLEQTLAALGVLAAQLPSMASSRATQQLHVGAAARLVGVRVSAVRFWEQQGLLQPARESGSRYRVYGERQLRRLRIVALLRQANYDFAAIRTTLDELEAGQPQRAVAAVTQRRAELAGLSWRCLQALASFYAYASEFSDLAPPGDLTPASARGRHPLLIPKRGENPWSVSTGVSARVCSLVRQRALTSSARAARLAKKWPTFSCTAALVPRQVFAATSSRTHAQMASSALKSGL
ncbi:MAG: MerR family transcriptional regulator [Chloroflexia bacterium]